MSKNNGKTVNRRSKHNALENAKKSGRCGMLPAKITEFPKKRRFDPFGSPKKTKRGKK